MKGTESVAKKKEDFMIIVTKMKVGTRRKKKPEIHYEILRFYLGAMSWRDDSERTVSWHLPFGMVR